MGYMGYMQDVMQYIMQYAIQGYARSGRIMLYREPGLGINMHQINVCIMYCIVIYGPWEVEREG